MIRRLAQFTTAPVVLCAALAATADAADEAAVLAGYRTLYSGDADAARRHFEKLVAESQGDLAVRFACSWSRKRASATIVPNPPRSSVGSTRINPAIPVRAR